MPVFSYVFAASRYFFCLKRREKDYKEALKIYNDVLKEYPSHTEAARWGIGWTYYLSGDYKKSAEIFSKMYASYDDPKYIYWKARSIEADGNDAEDLYNSLMEMGNNVYSALSYEKNNKRITRSASFSIKAVDAPAKKLKKIERIETLQSLDMSQEAVSELIALSKRIDTPEILR